jgi:TPR repeat protein
MSQASTTKAFAILGLLGLAAACASDPPREVPRKVYPEDKEASAHEKEGLRLFATTADSMSDSQAARTAAQGELALAVAKVPSPDFRLAHARVTLLLDPASAPAREELAAILAEAPDHAPALALSAFVEAQDATSKSDLASAAERAERALALAAEGKTDRATQCFVGEQAVIVGANLQGKDPVRAAALVVHASQLGSPLATMNVAKMYWFGRGPKMDRAKAIELATTASRTTFSPEEVSTGLLLGVGVEARRDARLLGEMLVEEDRLDEARDALARGVSHPEEAAFFGHDRDQNFQVGFDDALFALGTIEGERGQDHLEAAAAAGNVPALVRLGRLFAKTDPEQAKSYWEKAKRRGSLAALGCLGEWDELATVARAQADGLKPSPEKLYALRTSIFAQAVSKGGGFRVESEKAAHEAVEGAPENFPPARQLRHLAGDLSADDLEKTMPVAAHVPRWRAETELALATRALLTADRALAKKHLEICVATHAFTQPEDDLAWAALRALP